MPRINPPRISPEGWIALLAILISGVISHVTLANDQSHTAAKVTSNEKQLNAVQNIVQDIQTDIAIVKNEQRHMIRAVLELQARQTNDLKQIRILLEQRQ